jgi:rhamnosyltransferase
METINVLMSCYNGEKYIEEQLESILKQKTDRKIVVYIRDDGSKDNTVDILKKYEKADNIHVS